MHRIEGPSQMEAPASAPSLPQLAFSGAQLGPLVSWSAGEIYVATVAFYPDAFSAMTGLDLSAYVGRIVPAAEAVPPDILALFAGFGRRLASDGLDDARTPLEESLEDIWSCVRPPGSATSNWLADWTRSLVARAALSGTGRSARQLARRVRSWTGVSERDLHSLGQSERLYSKIHDGLETGDLDWADLATASGFADQAHMIRRMRRHTGFTPEQLRRLAPSEEALWGYRLLGEYFAKPDRPDDVARRH